MDNPISASAAAIMQEEYYRNLAKARIEAVYPLFKQINILRSGSAAEKDKMGKYIDAIRSWSNGDNPALAELEKIQP
ncbi:hypothetical protein HNO92_004291 [Chromobacterium alkanivorans]|uniref:hypothetical protein n=1 Tax=Chromobacterium alkanivorans TaxID=1071719 RepID=UPI0021687633|nr:hypothetical protein [Chromobacterium alkanivorans]MCS3806682.1 hypothetical protein [Chromobacterium alkanivorans]MCS3821146.1 hypothetical protein [Chromobacterium alkanivorans]MCS3875942.1 hypothetical protein [Chromobacterium alkanivorans]